MSNIAYNLHKPTINESIDFLENNTIENLDEIINKAKQTGIKCALAQIIMGKNLNMLELIAFDTIDNGVSYFEPQTEYYVEPKINNRYIYSVYQSPYNKTNPYKYVIYNDTIVDILTVW